MLPEANTTLAFEKRKKLYCQVNQQRERRQGSNLNPQNGVHPTFYELGKEGWCGEEVVGQVSLGGFGTWPFIVSKWNCLFSHVQLFATPWTIANQAPLSMEFSNQKYWSGKPFPSARDLPDPVIEPRSAALRADSRWSEPPRKWRLQHQIFLDNGPFPSKKV